MLMDDTVSSWLVGILFGCNASRCTYSDVVAVTLLLPLTINRFLVRSVTFDVQFWNALDLLLGNECEAMANLVQVGWWHGADRTRNSKIFVLAIEMLRRHVGRASFVGQIRILDASYSMQPLP